jgi:magnesium chelatase accessory protein
VSGGPSWQRDGGDWPNRTASRFVQAGPLTWHVQVMGSGPVALLMHGTGAASHSWRTLAPLLAKRFTVVAPDLPGHGFTETPPDAGFTLPAVASGIAALLGSLGLSPGLIAGHSAGAAVGVRMCLEGLARPNVLVSLNGALLPMPALPTDVLAPVARLFAGSTLTARALALMFGGEAAVQRLIRSGGSTIDPEGARLYARLAGSPAHVAGALRLMANWDLRPLARDLPRLATRLVLVTGSSDGMVPPSEAYRVRSLVPSAALISLPGLGHLAHEECPEQVADILLRSAAHEAAA